jgi:hypothetical protein
MARIAKDYGLAVPRGSWAMGFVIQMAPGKAEARAVVLDIPGRADNAARGHLGANTAVKIRGARPALAELRKL